jgi:iron-sulfur cluster assembly protein
MNICMTPAARERMHTFLAGEANAIGVRFGVRKTGCSGYSYTMDVANDVKPNDTVVEQDGLKLIVDAKSAPLIDGTEIDFARHGLNSTFVFRNPNSSGECGCGESFHVESAA